MRTPRTLPVLAAASFALVACGTSGGAASSPAAPITTARSVPTVPTTLVAVTPVAVTAVATAALPEALVRVDGALAALSASAAGAVWRAPGAIAAADGRAAFRVDGQTLVRVDTHAGTVSATWPLPAPGAWQVAVVGAGGRRVVVTDGPVDRAHRRSTTRLAVLDVDGTAPPQVLDLPGTVEPEALSVAGDRIFVLDHRDAYYRVRVVEVVSGEIADSYGRDKQPGEDMAGDAVRAVLSPAGDVLATLYQEPTGQHPFVHVLHLDLGWTYCADLPPGRYDRIAGSPDGHTVYVGTPEGSWAAVDLTTFAEASEDALPIAVHPTGAPPVPLASGGSMVAGPITVTADHGGVSWWRDGVEVGRVTRPVDRLVALVPG